MPSPKRLHRFVQLDAAKILYYIEFGWEVFYFMTSKVIKSAYPQSKQKSTLSFCREMCSGYISFESLNQSHSVQVSPFSLVGDLCFLT